MTDTTNEIKRLRDGLSAIVRCQRAIPRSAIREACAEILNGHTTHMLDQSVFIERLSALKAENAALRTRLAEAEKVIEPFADVGELLAADTEGFLPEDLISLVFGGTEYELGVDITHEQFRAAHAWKEVSNG